MPMEYQGKFPFFPFEKIKTYPIKTRKNKVTQKDLYFPDRVMAMKPGFSHPMLGRIADAMARGNCAFELMNQAFWWHPDLSVDEYVEQFVPVIQLFADAGVYFCVGSDAHSCGAVGNLAFCERLMEKGILCKETHESVVRFAPPLVITKEELDWALERIAAVLA